MTFLTRMAALFFSVLFTAGAASAGPAMLVDAKSGLVLYAENADYPWQPASLTKLMTAYLAFEAIRDGNSRSTTCSPVPLRRRSSSRVSLACPKERKSGWNSR